MAGNRGLGGEIETIKKKQVRTLELKMENIMSADLSKIFTVWAQWGSRDAEGEPSA